MRFRQIVEYKRPSGGGKGAQNAITPDVEAAVNHSVQALCIGDQLRHQFYELGWEALSEGHFSIVFTKPNLPYVLKVNQQSDKPFQHFVELSKRYPNRHFPKISAVKQIEYDEETFYIYTIEKLNKIKTSFDLYRFADTIEKIAIAPDLYLETILNNVRRISEEEKQWFRDHPGLVKAARLVGKEKQWTTIDIHDENIMQRKDGTIVIIDPYV